MKRLLMFLLVGMFLVSFASAWDWDNVVVEQNNNPKTGYPNLEIKNAFGLGETLFEGRLTEHTDSCGVNCLSKIEVNHKGGVLIDDIRFLTLQEDSSWLKQNVRSYRIKYEAELPKYEQQCVDSGQDYPNGTRRYDCSAVQTGTYSGYKYYQVGDELDAGNYEIYIEGNKKPSRTVDWQIKLHGQWLEEWAVWSAYGSGNSYVNLTSPTNGANAFTFEQNFTGAAEVIGGGSLVNMSLYTNNSGTWTRHNTTTFVIESIASGDSPSSIANRATKDGFRFVMNQDGVLGTVTIAGASGYTACYIYTDTAYTDLVDSGTVSGNGCSFTNLTVLTSGNTYYVVADAGGGNHNALEDIVGVSYPDVGTTASITAGIIGRTVRSDEAYGITELNFTQPASTESWNLTIADDIKWNVEACDTDSDCSFSTTNHSLLIDSGAPSITIDYPTGNITTLAEGTVDLNTTITDTNLDTCWYAYNNSVNTTIPVCADYNFPYDFGDENITVWANDSVGNLASATSTWDVGLVVHSQTFSASTLSGASEEFSINKSIGSGLQITSVNLVYNGTSYTGAFSQVGDYWITTRTISVPTVTATTNYTFYWSIALSDASITNTTLETQTVGTLSVDNCTTFTNVLYNFTMVDERTEVQFVGSTQNTIGKINLQLYSQDGTLAQTYNSTETAKNPFAVCLDNVFGSGNSYLIDLQLEYDADGYANEFYHIQQDSIGLADLNTNITLFNLEDAETQVFKIKFKDEFFNGVEDALIQIQRKHVGQNVFKTVEIPRTDTNGQAIAHLELHDASYTMIVVKNGEVLGTYNNVVAYCDNTLIDECEINLNAFGSSLSITDFATDDDFTYSLTWDETTSILQTVFTIPSGTTSTVLMNATLADQIGSTEICSDTLTSSSGTLSCTVPASFGNSTAYVSISVDGEQVGFAYIRLNEDPEDVYGSSIVFLTIFMMLTLIGIGISSSPMVTGIFIFLGAILSVGLNLVDATGFLGAGATILWLFVMIILIIIKGSKRQ